MSFYSMFLIPGFVSVLSVLPLILPDLKDDISMAILLPVGWSFAGTMTLEYPPIALVCFFVAIFYSYIFVKSYLPIIIKGVSK